MNVHDWRKVFAYLFLVGLSAFGLWRVNDEAHAGRERDCRNSRENRAVLREILEIRVTATPLDPAVGQYRLLLDRLGSIEGC